jgi:hypothetical protein
MLNVYDGWAILYVDFEEIKPFQLHWRDLESFC